MYLRFAEVPWVQVFDAFVEVNGSYFNTNDFYINTVIFSNTVILFMEGIPFVVFQYRQHYFLVLKYATMLLSVLMSINIMKFSVLMSINIMKFSVLLVQYIFDNSCRYTE